MCIFWLLANRYCEYHLRIEHPFALPIAYDLLAVFLFAITGALIAVKRGFDPVGVSIITIISGAGGGILRDAIFLNITPAAIRDWRYSAVLFVAMASVLVARSLLMTRPIAFIIMATEALGIGLNSVYGTQRSLDIKTSIYAAIIVGLVNGVGGRLMRDTVMGRKRKNLVPGRLYGVASSGAIAAFLILSEYFDLNAELSAWVAILVAFSVRMIAIKFDIKTQALKDYYDPSEILVTNVHRVIDPMKPRFSQLRYKRKFIEEEKPKE